MAHFRRYWRWALSVTFLGAGVACGGGGSVAPATLAVEPKTATATAPGEPVPFHAIVGGDVDVVVWTLAGPGSISPPSGLATTYTPPLAVDAETVAVLTARMNERSDTATITIKPAPPARVVGRVVDRGGRAVAGATVAIPPLATTTTDATGGFAIDAVGATYDVAALSPEGLVAPRTAVRYVGLHRRDPTLVLGFWQCQSRSATLAGALSGGTGYPEPSSHRTVAAFGAAGVDEVKTVPKSGSYNLDPVWCEGDAPSGEIHALQWRADAAGHPVEFSGHGRRLGVAPTDGATLAGLDIALAPIGTATLTGSVAVVGTNPPGIEVVAVYAPWTRIPLVSASIAPGIFAAKTPANASSIDVSATRGDVTTFLRGLAPDAKDVALTVTVPPLSTQPPDSATGVTFSTPFQWYPMDGTPVYVARFRVAERSYPLADFDVVTTATSTTLPDLASLGLSPYPTTRYLWEVFGTTAATSVDAAAGPDGYDIETNAYTQATGASRTFYTAATP